VRKARLGFAEMIESLQANPSSAATPAVRGEWRPR
jgi:hypothetical protein